MQNDLNRRTLLALVPGAFALVALPQAAQAITVDQARNLIDRLVAEINSVINSGTSPGAMYGKFEGIFARYADVNYIAKSALGPAGRSASAGEISAYTKAFQRYISHKYGKRFREFIGGSIEVRDARPLKSYYEVVSQAKLQGQAPFEVRWHVVDRGGKSLFFNLIIEGVNMLASERAEIGAMLDKAGSIGALTETLKAAA